MTPKWVVVAVAALAGVALLPREANGPAPVALAALANLAACGVSLVLSDGPRPWWTLAGPVLIAGLALSTPPVPWPAVLWAGGLESLVVLFQALGLDPFATFAPHAGGARLGLYGTLGNPDFVASVLSLTVPLGVVAALRSSRPRLAGASVALQLLGLALLRSFASALSLATAAIVVALAGGLRGTRGLRTFALVLAAGIAVTALPLVGRSPGSVLRGRWYLVATAAPHVREAPWLGQGPGVVVLRWPEWELERWRARCGTDPACVASHPERRFAALQDHVHDDWLERLLESGIAGLLALVALFLSAFLAALRRGTPEGTGVAAALASLAVRATVDFPLSRPADLVLLAVLCGAAAQRGVVSVDAPGPSPPDSPPRGGAS